MRCDMECLETGLDYAVRHAAPGDAALFESLWLELLESQQEYGVDILPTERTMAYFGGIFRAFVGGERKGVVLFGADDNCVLMWGEHGTPVPWDHALGAFVQGWGIYVRKGYRRKGWSDRLRDEAIRVLRGMGFNKMIGEFLVGNTALQETLPRHGGRVRAFMFSLDFDEKRAQRDEIRHGARGSDVAESSRTGEH